MFIGVNNAISKAPEEFAFDPTVDGPGGLLPELPSGILSRGAFAKLPFIAGTNLDEGQHKHLYKLFSYDRIYSSVLLL